MTTTIAPAEPALPYGPRVTWLLPRIQRGFRVANRYLAVPMLRAGLGPLCNTPLTGSLMVLRTRGRTSGLWREAPLGYLILDGHVYCCAGFGYRTHWLRNIEADPHVELLLPAIAVTGIAEEVTDPAEWSRGMRPLLASLGIISRAVIGDVRHVSDDGLRAMAGGLPLIRIRVTGLGVGPFDPGGRGWVLPTIVGASWLAGRFARRRKRGRQD